MNGDVFRNRTGDIGENIRANGASSLLDVVFLMVPEQSFMHKILANDNRAESIVMVSWIFVAEPNREFESRTRYACNTPLGLPYRVKRVTRGTRAEDGRIVLTITFRYCQLALQERICCEALRKNYQISIQTTGKPIMKIASR